MELDSRPSLAGANAYAVSTAFTTPVGHFEELMDVNHVQEVEVAVQMGAITLVHQADCYRPMGSR